MSLELDMRRPRTDQRFLLINGDAKRRFLQVVKKPAIVTGIFCKQSTSSTAAESRRCAPVLDGRVGLGLK